MWCKIKERVSNLFDFVTSKKVLIAVAGVAAILLLVTSPAKIIAIGAVVVAYEVAQGLVDIQKAKYNEAVKMKKLNAKK